MSGDIRIELKAKNNRLWHAIFDQFKSVRAFCLSDPRLRRQQVTIGRLLAFKRSPFIKSRDGFGKWKYNLEYCKAALLVAEVLRQLPEDLFPRALYENIVGKAEQSIEIPMAALSRSTRRELLSLPASAETNPEIMYEIKERGERIHKVLDTLRPREKRVLKLRFMEKRTLDEVAQELGVSLERARQIEYKALNCLRHPTRRPLLKEILGDEYDIGEFDSHIRRKLARDREVSP